MGLSHLASPRTLTLLPYPWTRGRRQLRKVPRAVQSNPQVDRGTEWVSAFVHGHPPSGGRVSPLLRDPPNYHGKQDP